jgi:uncharacterized membrane protein
LIVLKVLKFIAGALLGGLLVLAPIYLVILLVLRGMELVAGLVKPIAALLPHWFPGESVVSLLLVLGICFLVGLIVRTQFGSGARDWIERWLDRWVPGYGMLKNLTQQVAGDPQQMAWKPAMVEIEDALVPAFIIEEHADGRFTIFVPSIPTPFTGAVYVMARSRVHPLDVPFTTALKAISRWGVGTMDLVSAIGRSDLRDGSP